MAIYRLHKSDWEKGSGTISQIQAPEPIDLWGLDGQLNTFYKRRKLAKQLGVDNQTGKHSRVCLFPFSSSKNNL